MLLIISVMGVLDEKSQGYGFASYSWAYNAGPIRHEILTKVSQ